MFTGTTVPANYEKRIGYAYDSNKNLVRSLRNGESVSAYKWGYNNKFPVAECKNASETEFYYEGYEDNIQADSTSGAHTGRKCTTSATVSWAAPNSRTYVISYWYKLGNTWLYSGEQAYSGNSFTMQNGSRYDDIRIQPKDAQMTTYTYEPLVGMKSATDAKGQTVYYKYDSYQRLKYVKDQHGNILKQTEYHFQNQ